MEDYQKKLPLKRSIATKSLLGDTTNLLFFTEGLSVFETFGFVRNFYRFCQYFFG